MPCIIDSLARVAMEGFRRVRRVLRLLDENLQALSPRSLEPFGTLTSAHEVSVLVLLKTLLHVKLSI